MWNRVAVICAGMIVLLLISRHYGQEKAKTFGSIVPLGATVDEVERFIERRGLEGHVIERQSRAGKSHSEDLGELSDAFENHPRKRSFNGNVIVNPDDAVTIWFEFMDGHLVKRAWGYLPG